MTFIVSLAKKVRSWMIIFCRICGKRMTSRQKKKPHGKRGKPHGKRKRLTVKRESRHGKRNNLYNSSKPLCFLLCREDIAISFAVKVYFFFPEYFSFCREVFSFAVRFFFCSDSFPFCHVCTYFAGIVPFTLMNLYSKMYKN